MKAMKKIAVTAALVSPFVFGTVTEAGAEQEPTTTPSSVEAEEPTSYHVPQSRYESTAYYSEEDYRGLINVGFAALGSAALFGVILYKVWQKDSREQNVNHEGIVSIGPLDQEVSVEIVPQHTTPVGPEDDPAFWSPNK